MSEFSDAPEPRTAGDVWRRRLGRIAGSALRLPALAARGLLGLARAPKRSKLSMARGRLGLAMLGFGAVYVVIAGKLVLYAVLPDASETPGRISSDAISSSRPDIVDRNGEILATDIRTPSLFAEPRRLLDVDEALEKLSAILPDLDKVEARTRLSSKKGFVWLKREITPSQQRRIHLLGLPGIGFMMENRRVYPNGPTVSHVIGHVNVDNEGIAGIEKYLDNRGLAALHRAGFTTDRLTTQVQLSIDLRVQHALRDELGQALTKFRAKAAAGLITDVRTGEIIAMVSLPDYDPNDPGKSMDDSRINRLTTGVFELGSTFKALTTAMALDSGLVKLDDRFDARFPLQYGSFRINDYHGTKRVLNVPEIFIHSSNIGTARMALKLGVENHKAFLKKMGQFDRLVTELPESAAPLYPKRWVELNTVTASYGHGIAVAPLQAVAAVSALLNGGYWIQPTFLKRTPEDAQAIARRVIKKETSDALRFVMRLNAEKGSAKKADILGFYVGGKTGTSEKVINGRYSKNKLFNTFMAAMPMNDPKYMVTIMLDEPQGLKETYGFATSGWNAAPTAGKVIARVAPLLGLDPKIDMPPAIQSIPVAFRGTAQ